MAKTDFHSFGLLERHHKPFIDLSRRRNKGKNMPVDHEVKPSNLIYTLGQWAARFSQWTLLY